MPRTKAANRSKNNSSLAAAAAAKRNRDSVTEEAMSSALRGLESIVEAHMFDIALDYEQRSDQLNNMFRDIRMQLGQRMLGMTLEAVAHQQLQQQQQQHLADASAMMSSCSASMFGEGGGTGSAGAPAGQRRTPRDDEGYLTEESTAHSSTLSSMASGMVPQLSQPHTSRPTGRPLGPLASAKAKSRRSRSAQSNPDLTNSSSINPNNTTHGHNSSTLQRANSQRQPRSKYRTPAMSRLQTLSAERGGVMAPVTPKMQPDRPLAMLRYQKIGETVISLSGSPVIAQGVTREGANINIPVANGVISVLPSAMSTVEPNFMAQLDPQTLQQLRMLQSNLNLMMSQVKD